MQKLSIRSFSVTNSLGVMLCFKIQLIASGTECNASTSSRKITCFIVAVDLLLTIPKLCVNFRRLIAHYFVETLPEFIFHSIFVEIITSVNTTISYRLTWSSTQVKTQNKYRSYWFQWLLARFSVPTTKKKNPRFIFSTLRFTDTLVCQTDGERKCAGDVLITTGGFSTEVRDE